MSVTLKAAIETHDPATVREALKSVPDLNAKLFGNKNAVALACELDAEQALEALLEAKAKVQGKHAEHPFVIAAEHQRHKVMLHLVVRTGDIETIRAMVECGADINARNERGRHASHATRRWRVRLRSPNRRLSPVPGTPERAGQGTARTG